MSCTPTPTETQFTTVIGTSTFTSFSDSVTTLPESETTIFSTTCLVTASDGSCNSSSVASQISTVAGGESTVQVPVILTSSVTQTEATATLFAPCPSGNSDSSSSSSSTTSPSQPPSSPPVSPSSPPPSGNSNSDTSTTSQISTSLTTSSTTSTFTSLSTPPPTTFITTSATTLGNGAVSEVTMTMTSTLPASTILEQTVVPAATLAAGPSDGSGTGSNTGAIVGGVVGGVVGLLAIVGLIWCLWRRSSRWNDIFEDDAEEADPRPVRSSKKKKRFELDTDEPKPYVYGLVGQAPATSPSPPPMENAPIHSRTTSLTPLVLSAVSGDTNHMASNSSSGPAGSNAYSSAPSSAPSYGATSEERHASRPPSLVLGNAAFGSDTSMFSTRVSGLGSPVSAMHVNAGQQGVLRLVNDEPSSPASSIASRRQSSDFTQVRTVISPTSDSFGKRTQRASSPPVIVHKDGGRVPQEPPAYS